MLFVGWLLSMQLTFIICHYFDINDSVMSVDQNHKLKVEWSAKFRAAVFLGCWVHVGFQLLNFDRWFWPCWSCCWFQQLCWNCCLLKYGFSHVGLWSYSVLNFYLNLVIDDMFLCFIGFYLKLDKYSLSVLIHGCMDFRFVNVNLRYKLLLFLCYYNCELKLTS